MEGAAIMGLSLAKVRRKSPSRTERSSKETSTISPSLRIDEAPMVTNVYIVPADDDTRTERRRRAWRSAIRAGLVERNLRGDRKAYPGASIGKQLEA